MEPGRCVGVAVEVDAVQKQHVEMNVEIEGTDEALDQRDRAGVSGVLRKTRFLNIKVRGNDAIDEAQCLYGLSKIVQVLAILLSVRASRNSSVRLRHRRGIRLLCQRDIVRRRFCHRRHHSLGNQICQRIAG